MSATQFSAQMLRKSKKHDFCGKVHLLAKTESFQSFEASKSVKSKLFHFVSCPLGEKLVKDLFWQKWCLFKGLTASKSVKSKLCSFCELRAWSKTSQGSLLTKMLAFQSSEVASKSVKIKLCSFCELPAWWKTSQGPLLTKIVSFQSSEVSK